MRVVLFCIMALLFSIIESSNMAAARPRWRHVDSWSDTCRAAPWRHIPRRDAHGTIFLMTSGSFNYVFLRETGAPWSVAKECCATGQRWIASELSCPLCIFFTLFEPCLHSRNATAPRQPSTPQPVFCTSAEGSLGAGAPPASASVPFACHMPLAWPFDGRWQRSACDLSVAVAHRGPLRWAAGPSCF